jgi:hypothetical protein
MLGHRLSQETTGGRDMKALLVLVGSSDSPAQDLAAALGVPEDVLEAAYNDVRAERVSRLGAEAAEHARARQVQSAGR